MSTWGRFSNDQKWCLRKFNFYLKTVFKKCSGSDSSVLIYFYFSSAIYFVASCTHCSTCVVMAAQFCTSALCAGTKPLRECLCVPGMKHPKGPNVELWVHRKNIRKEVNSAVCSLVKPLQQLSRWILVVIDKSAKLTTPMNIEVLPIPCNCHQVVPTLDTPILPHSFSLQFVPHPSSL